MDETRTFQDKQSVIVILPPNPNPDMVAAGLSLTFPLVNAGKKFQMVLTVQSLQTLKDNKPYRFCRLKRTSLSFDYPEEFLEKLRRLAWR
jgi:hypothetical protein